MYIIIYLRWNKKQAMIFNFPWCRLAGKSIVHGLEMDIPGNEALSAVVCSSEVKPSVRLTCGILEMKTGLSSRSSRRSWFWPACVALRHGSLRFTSFSEGWWALRDSNPRPPRCKRDALTTAPNARRIGKYQSVKVKQVECCGRKKGGGRISPVTPDWQEKVG